MKKKIAWLVMVAMISFLWSCKVEAVNLEWDANTDDTVKYRVYSSTISGIYDVDEYEETTLNTYTMDLPDGKYYFVVTAIDEADNESGYSNEVTTSIDTMPPMVPGTLRIVP